jgi:hypothetical protein
MLTFKPIYLWPINRVAVVISVSEHQRSLLYIYKGSRGKTIQEINKQ